MIEMIALVILLVLAAAAFRLGLSAGHNTFPGRALDAPAVCDGIGNVGSKGDLETAGRQDRPDWERRTCCSDTLGNRWRQVHARYKNNTVHKGGFDEVITVYRNDKYQGHVTSHFDANGNLQTKNTHGSTNVPCTLRAC